MFSQCLVWQGTGTYKLWLPACHTWQNVGVQDTPIIPSFLDTNGHPLLYTIPLDNFVGLYQKSTISGLVIGPEWRQVTIGMEW